MLYEKTKDPGIEYTHCIPGMPYEATKGFHISASISSPFFIVVLISGLNKYEDCVFLTTRWPNMALDAIRA